MRVAIRLSAAAIVGLFYWFCITSTNERLVWNRDLDGYYDLLGRGFAAGQLSLPIRPSRELLRLSDPWDPALNQDLGLQDASLYRERYYLYHGAAPALLLFAPWRLVTRHDLPERFAAFLLCFGGYLFLCALLLRLLSVSPPPWLMALLLLGMGLAQPAAFLLQRVKVYEIAIAGGYFCVSAGFYLLARALAGEKRPQLWTAFSGLFFGFAVGCRPHLGLAAAFVFLLFLFPARRKFLLPFTLPLAACAIALALYNYARFYDPLEFGLRYQLADSLYQNVRLSFASALPGLYYLLWSPPAFSRVFPFVRLALDWPFSLPSRYFIEPIAGAIRIVPIALVGLLFPLLTKTLTGRPSVKPVLWSLYLFSLSCVLFIAGTGLVSHRFEVDFVPYLALIGAAVLAAWKRRAALVLLIPALLYGIAANTALAIQGPYDQFLQENPDRYMAIARWFSPSEYFRPVRNPHLAVEALYAFPNSETNAREPLVSLGDFGSRYALLVQRIDETHVKLYSESAPASMSMEVAEVPLAASGIDRLRIEFNPPDTSMHVIWNGEPVIRHGLRFLITAPAQIRFGADPLFGNAGKFSGRIFEARTSLTR